MRLKKLPDVEYLRSKFKYDAETGELTRISGRKKGCSALLQHPDGYYYVSILGSNYLAHRIIWKLVTGNEPSAHIDHRNRVRNDNHWENLREATIGDNNMNSSIRADNTSKVRGARYHKAAKKFHAEISVNKKRKHLGVFDTLEEAAKAYEDAVKAYHGDFANTEIRK